MTVATLFAGLALAQAGCGVDESDHAEGLARGDRGPEVLELYRYLQAYGYLPNPALAAYTGGAPVVAEAPADAQIFDEALERALVLFQQTHGLPADGVLNERTQQLMKTPRCGFPDHTGGREAGVPASFTPSGYRWPTGNISYSYSNFTPDLPATTTQSAIDGAFTRWAAVAPLSFTQVAAGDIAIGFHAGDHGDGYSFDGASGVLAHAFYPTIGDIHFDEAETWSNSGGGIDLASVALHELGHSLGLAHSSNSSAVMWPYYTGMRRELATDDIQGIQALYLRAPNPINRFSEYCAGANTIQWTAQAGATYYQLYRAFSASFTNPTVIYSGASTEEWINVSPGSTWYLRAKACNANGCSDYSSQVSATYYNGVCL